MNLQAALRVLEGESTLPPPPAVPSFGTLDAIDAWNRDRNAAYLLEELQKRDARVVALESSLRLAKDLLAKGHVISAGIALARALGER